MPRPRNFDEDEVLERALHVFWRLGYEGASVAELTEATGLTKSSLYNAFNSKDDLYRLANERYRRLYLGFQAEALAETSPRRIAKALLLGVADLHTAEGTPPGCFETNGTLACSPESENIRLELVEKRRAMQVRIRDRFEATRTAGRLPEGLKSDEAAAFVMTLIQGMAVQAKGGATRVDLRKFVEIALRAWPED